jgi:hypothetical protein
LYSVALHHPKAISQKFFGFLLSSNHRWRITEYRRPVAHFMYLCRHKFKYPLLESSMTLAAKRLIADYMQTPTS